MFITDISEKSNYKNKNRGLSDDEVKTRGLEALHRIRGQASKNKHKFTLDEINEIIAETRKNIDFSKYSTGKSLFKSSKEIEEYLKELREDREIK